MESYFNMSKLNFRINKSASFFFSFFSRQKPIQVICFIAIILKIFLSFVASYFFFFLHEVDTCRHHQFIHFIVIFFFSEIYEKNPTKKAYLQYAEDKKSNFNFTIMYKYTTCSSIVNYNMGVKSSYFTIITQEQV